MIRRKNRNALQVSTDELRQSGNSQLNLEIPDSSPNPEQTYVERERRKMLYKAICGLRPGIRAAVEIGQMQERSLKETARVLDISVAAAKGRLFHGRAALRKSDALRCIAQARTEPAA
jgi:DNA-directed RNA polymerase specialized sigma24 family protein